MQQGLMINGDKLTTITDDIKAIKQNKQSNYTYVLKI